MFTHDQIWLAIDRLAKGTGNSTSGLAKLAGLDPTSFNRSKRYSADGKPRWPSTESLSKVLNVTNITMVEFTHFIEKSENQNMQRIMEVKDYNIRLPNGKTTRWSRVESPDISVIIALDDEYNVYLVKQFRLSLEKEILELPSGRLDMTDKTTEAGAKRELLEETGLKAKSWHFLKTVSLWNHASVKAHFYLATGLEQSLQKLDADEFIEFTKVPLDKAQNVIEEYGGSNAQSLLGLSLAKEWLSKYRK